MSLWLHLCGSALLLVSAWQLGVQKASHLRRRAVQLSHWLTALALLQSEIVIGEAQMPQALSLVAQRLPEPTSIVLLSVSAMLAEGHATTLQNAFREAWSSVLTHLSETDRQVLEELASALGGSDRRDQQRHLVRCQSRLNTLQAEAVEESRRLGRLWQSLCPLLGLLVVLLLA